MSTDENKRDQPVPSDVSEDARTLLVTIMERQGKAESTLDTDLIAALGWRKGRYEDAREELKDLDKVQQIFLPVPFVAMIADGAAKLVQEVMRDQMSTRMWLAQPQEYRDWIISQASNVISNRWSTPKDFHEHRRALLLADGWKHGDALDPKQKISNELRPWEDMELWYKMTWIIFVNTVRLLSREPRG